jgi:aflatoxin B1 aldehyde reductase
MAPKLVFGGFTIIEQCFPTQEKVQELFDLLKKHNIHTIDTARIYSAGANESYIGQQPGHVDFAIDTKWGGGFTPGTLSKASVISEADDSYSKMKIKQFDTFYIHAPDPAANIEEVLDGVQEVYKKGIFRRFGLSNFSAEQVREVYDMCKRKGYVLPSVYQGNYNAVARKLETLLLPTLRELGIPFYAYSPIAGGFLAKSREQVEAGEGRFSMQGVSDIYTRLYSSRKTLMEALDDWSKIAEREGVSRAELAYRWVVYHGALKGEYGDAVIFGGRTYAQIEETIGFCEKGPLSDEAVKGIEAIWKKVEAEAPVDNLAG